MCKFREDKSDLAMRPPSSTSKLLAYEKSACSLSALWIIWHLLVIISTNLKRFPKSGGPFVKVSRSHETIERLIYVEKSVNRSRCEKQEDVSQ